MRTRSAAVIFVAAIATANLLVAWLGPVVLAGQCVRSDRSGLVFEGLDARPVAPSAVEDVGAYRDGWRSVVGVEPGSWPYRCGVDGGVHGGGAGDAGRG